MRKTIHTLGYTLGLVSCFLMISLLSACADGIFSLRGYIPEEAYPEEEPLPPAEPAPAPKVPQNQQTPDFIIKILKDTKVPPPDEFVPPPPKKPEPDPLDAS